MKLNRNCHNGLFHTKCKATPSPFVPAPLRLPVMGFAFLDWIKAAAVLNCLCTESILGFCYVFNTLTWVFFSFSCIWMVFLNRKSINHWNSVCGVKNWSSHL